ncbi:hypothetical protein ASF49_08265 [Methylobacterium sp. Leaf104]|uniref:hypothetical protein n=1 Tax=Methylobacterium TaxID=407 RepID=UPI0006F45943|nr:MULTISPECIES: hypothetical protein [Methylobacterium]KQP33850.1 hypothetical protein ASF49_08265 [Methylobacterium sp. Leaf104]MCI9879579.1 hypothetical protein [Methylobacterium goesingense]
MGSAAAVHDDRTGPPLAKVEASFTERRQKRIAFVGHPPCLQRGRPQVVEGDAGALLDQALGR